MVSISKKAHTDVRIIFSTSYISLLALHGHLRPINKESIDLSGIVTSYWWKSGYYETYLTPVITLCTIVLCAEPMLMLFPPSDQLDVHQHILKIIQKNMKRSLRWWEFQNFLQIPNNMSGKTKILLNSVIRK